MNKVTHDLFQIARRLKQINRDYCVFWNNKANRYEVHTNHFEFAVPYDRLDCRTIDYALKTRKQNAHQIECEINAHNNELVKSAEKQLYTVRAELEDMLGYAMRTGRDVNFTRNYIKEF